MTMHIYTGSAAKEIDRIAIQQYGYAGFGLMTLAGESAYRFIASRFAGPGSLLVLCGAGNNGGDGYVLARCALSEGWQVTVVSTGPPNTADAGMAREKYTDAGGSVADSWPVAGRFDLVVDAVLGVGINGAPRQAAADMIEQANALSAYKFALDVPSGTDADTGRAWQPHFKADATLTFIAPKIGLLGGPARTAAGNVHVEPLGIDDKVLADVGHCAAFVNQPQFPKRAADTHKGHYGHVVIAGGNDGMLGAVLLAGCAALRSGAGKVHIVSTKKHLDQPGLYRPELMSAVFDAANNELLGIGDAIALGPGLGLDSWGEQVFDAVLRQHNTMVIDADALRLLARCDALSTKGNWVLTPHPGEAAALLGCSTADVQNNRLNAVTQIARERNSVCVLKGAGTLIADPQGIVNLCDHGNPGMSTAGMGDVLTGMIAAFCAQGTAVPRGG